MTTEDDVFGNIVDPCPVRHRPDGEDLLFRECHRLSSAVASEGLFPTVRRRRCLRRAALGHDNEGVVSRTVAATFNQNAPHPICDIREWACCTSTAAASWRRLVSRHQSLGP